MRKNEVKAFLSSHRDMEISAAKMEYTMYLYPDFDKNVLDAMQAKNTSEEDINMEIMIDQAATGAELLQLMRRHMSGLNRYKLRQKLLMYEEEMIPLIEKRAITNRLDFFIENAIYFFLHCKENVVDWIITNYDNFCSEYLKSMFCLILGFRGDENLIPFLIKEAERFEKAYPEESYDQGPVLAVQELAIRCLNMKLKK